MHLRPRRPALLRAEEAQLPQSLLVRHVLHTLTNSVAAAGLQLVPISLAPGTQTGHSAPHTASAVPGGEQHSPDDDLRASNFGMTRKKQLKLECGAMPLTYHNRAVRS